MKREAPHRADTLAAITRVGLVGVTPAPPAARFVFRGGDAAIRACGEAFALSLPRQACRSVEAGARAALWLGPDEWLLIAPDEEAEALAGALASALGGIPHSLVDSSHRSAGVRIDGAGAADVLNAGCPLDLSREAFPPGACTRTVFAKAEIMLWRTGEEAFRLETGRSFMAYVLGIIAEACLDEAG